MKKYFLLSLLLTLLCVNMHAFTVTQDGFEHEYEIISLANREVRLVKGGEFNYGNPKVDFHVPSTVTYGDVTFNIVEYAIDVFVYAKNIYFDEGVRKIKSVVPVAYSIYCTDFNQSPSTYPTDLYLPSTLEEIGDDFVSGTFPGWDGAFDSDEYPVHVHFDPNTHLNMKTLKGSMLANALSVDLFVLNGIETIEPGALSNVDFRDSSGNYITDFVLPEGLKTIGESAFSTFVSSSAGFKDSPVNRIVIPSSVEYIGPSAFCGRGSEVSVAESNPKYCSVDGVLYTKDMKTLCHYPSKKGDISFSIPESVDTIHVGAMCNLKNLRDLTINGNYEFVELSSPPVNTFKSPIMYCSFDNLFYGSKMTTIESPAYHYVLRDCSIKRSTVPNNVLKAISVTAGKTFVIASGTEPLTVVGTSSRKSSPPTTGECYINRPIQLEPATKRYAELFRNFKDIYVATSHEEDLSWVTGVHYGTNLYLCSNPPACSLEFTDENYAFQNVYVPEGTLEQYKAHPIWGKFLHLEESMSLTNSDAQANPPVDGDINRDSLVNTGDVSALYELILGDAVQGVGDLNGDGEVNAGDISALYRLILGN